MTKTKFVCMLVAGLMISSSFVWAASPQDYTISYTFKNPDGSIFRIIKYYLSDNNKFRLEYASPVQYNISSEVSSEVNLESKDSVIASEATAELKPEYLTDVEPHTIEILQKDKNLVWSLSPELKNYNEFQLREDSWERAINGNFIFDFSRLTKTGEVKILDYTCGIYESVRKVQDDTWTNIFYVAQDLNVILKSEMLKNGNLVQLQEATEFSMEKPASMLFEVPEGYQKNDNN